MDIVIIGAGPAGCAAAVQCKRLGVEPVLLERTGQAGGMVVNAFSMENYLGVDPIPGTAFVARMARHLERFDLEVEQADVQDVRRCERGWEIRTRTGHVEARAIIVAVGTEPRELDVPGARPLRDALLFYEVHALMKKIVEPGHVVMIGGGEAAFDYALSLVRAGARVTLVVRGAGLRARGRLVALAEDAPAIRFLFNTRPLALTPVVQGTSRIAATLDAHPGPDSDGLHSILHRPGLRVDVEGPAGVKHLDCNAALAAIGRVSAAPAVLAAIGRVRAAPAVLAAIGRVSAAPAHPDAVSQSGAAPALPDAVGVEPALTNGVRTSWPGLFVAGDARSGTLGQVGMAVGDGLRAAMAACDYLEQER